MRGAPSRSSASSAPLPPTSGASSPPRLMVVMAGSIPAQTEGSRALSKDLRKRGFSFVGPTTSYAFMQAMGLVNDHVHDCFLPGRVGGGTGPAAAPRLTTRPTRSGADGSQSRLHPEIGRQPDILEQVRRKLRRAAGPVGPECPPEQRIGAASGDEQLQVSDEAPLDLVVAGLEDARRFAVLHDENDRGRFLGRARSSGGKFRLGTRQGPGWAPYRKPSGFWAPAPRASAQGRAGGGPAPVASRAICSAAPPEPAARWPAS